MGCRGRRTGAAAALISLCLGMTGCLSTGGNFPHLTQHGANPGYPTAQRTGHVNAPPGTMMVVGPNGQLQPVSYQQAPRARFGNTGVMPAQANELIVEQPTMGTPVGVGVMHGHGPDLPTPTELRPSSHPPHRVAPPDILWLEALRMVPRGPYRLEPFEVLQIEVPENTFPKQDIRGPYTITPEGYVNLGFNYGRVLVRGLTIDEAHRAIRDHLNNIIKNASVSVTLLQMRQMQNIRGEHLVRPDGTISLGMYGSVYVAGMNLGQVKCVIERHMSAYLVDPQIAVDVFAYNSRKIYIIADGAGYGQQVVMLPATGNETVLDVIGRVQGLPPVASQKRIWVARPSPAGHPCSQILPVDWKAITQAGRTETNHQLFPGDRVYISSDPLLLGYNYLDKVLAPIERILGVTLLGASTVQSLSGTNQGVLLAR